MSDLLSAQGLYAQFMKHVIEVTSWGTGRDDHGKPVLDTSTTRRYTCLVQPNEATRWGTPGATDELPYIAYVLTVPIGQSEPVPIRVEEQITVVNPVYLASDTPRRMGRVQTYPDQFGNMFVVVVTFE